MALGPSYNLPKNYMNFCPIYILPKNKNKDKAQIHLSKDLNLEARLWNEKVLGTHSAQRGLIFQTLVTNVPFMHVMNDMLNM